MKILIKNLSKSFHHYKVHDNFSLSIERAEKVGLYGPNGSGKTTLLKIISGIMSFEKGRYSSIKEGSEVLVSHYEPEVPYTFNNGRLEAVYVGGSMQVAGLKPTEQFRICSSYIYPSNVQPAGGQGQQGTSSPPTGPTISGMTVEQTKNHCNTVYSLGEYKQITEFVDSNRAITGVNISTECLEAIEKFEGFWMLRDIELIS